ncbi:hypothetical protein GF391_03795 [Candidatus Uhrbacteria bacterium]|nr:hypothetical protein [Candidatus Uhrbacteria bacterium]
MKFITNLIAIFALLVLTAPPASAETISSGDLIKASGSAVYYYGADGKRYVFPTEKTFFSWYDNFDTVKTISDGDLAMLPIGGNVTYRPGVRMVKITTDPKTYAVDTGGVLRHITSESVAIILYGDNWNTKVDDIPDAFFTNYTMGDPITNSADYNPAEAMAAATEINADKNLTTPPDDPEDPETPPSANTVQFGVSDSTPRPGDVITLSVTADQEEGVDEIQIFVDEILVTTCTSNNTCTGDYQIPVIVDDTTRTARAIVTFINDTQLSQEIELQIDENAVGNGVYIYADRTVIKEGQSTGVTVDAPDIAVRRIEIFVDNMGQKVCESGIRTCQLSVAPGGSIGSSVTVHGLVTDDLGRTYRSENLVISIAENDSPLVTIQPDKNTIYTGETVNVTVEASDQDGIQYIEILDSSRQILKHCDGAAPCTYQVGPWAQTGSYTFYGLAADTQNATEEQSTIIDVINPN